MDILLIYNSKDKVSECIILLEFSSYKFVHTMCENCLGKKWLKLSEIWYSQS